MITPRTVDLSDHLEVATFKCIKNQFETILEKKVPFYVRPINLVPVFDEHFN